MTGFSLVTLWVRYLMQSYWKIILIFIRERVF